MAPLEACRHCAGRIRDPDQRTCPHCLEALATRTFQAEEDLERFREDRRAHGAPVPEDEGGRGSGVALVLGATAAVMIVAGGGIAFGGLASGSFARATRALGEAAVPLAMGIGLFEMARRLHGGWT